MDMAASYNLVQLSQHLKGVEASVSASNLFNKTYYSCYDQNNCWFGQSAMWRRDSNTYSDPAPGPVPGPAAPLAVRDNRQFTGAGGFEELTTDTQASALADHGALFAVVAGVIPSLKGRLAGVGDRPHLLAAPPFSPCRGGGGAI